MLMWSCLTMGRWSWVRVLELALVELGSGCSGRMPLLRTRRFKGSCCWMDVARNGHGDKLVCHVLLDRAGLYI